MPAGRKKIPTNIHVLNGTNKPCRQNKEEPKPDIPFEVPPPPSFLSESATEEWLSISKKLHKIGLLTEIDQSALALYCQAWGEFVDAQKEIYGNEDENIIGLGFTITTDKGNEIMNPVVGISHRAMELSHKFLVEFGMTPSSRTKTKGNNPALKQNKFSGNMERQAS